MRLVQGIYLLSGSNLGDRKRNLENALQLIKGRVGAIINCSEVYGSKAWGETDQPDFYNQVMEVETNLSHEPLLMQLQTIEKELGKLKVGRWRERLIDLDILYYRNRIVKTPQLTIPHPEIQNRNFTLWPLCEIAGGDVHPVLLKSHDQMLQESPDPLSVWRLSERPVEDTEKNSK